jgi:hypothetical protein
LRSADHIEAQRKQGSTTPPPTDVASFQRYVQADEARLRAMTAGMKFE